ncbi:ribonuclease H-like domain-containing protein, partial [Lentinula raphanica]
YTDGSCQHNGSDEAKAGAGIYYGEDNILNKSIRIPDNLPQTNQTGEIISTKVAATDVDPGHSLTILSDSKTAIDGLTRNRQRWEDNGFIGVANATEIQTTIAALRERSTPTTLKWVKGHSGLEGNDKADELAKLG